ncbi:MAG TPA: cupin domain-containing protein [Thermodesulfobacteriota bacterium]|nr:cupin domain-containing protein [Deltaproteobacteria bacterium]HNR14315.1 cupin domain-containing protein [Thermodesulfobacteriota bacterium]HNU72187.1 cupin domain-containing protein [Thermodesulfobacteriota bacterium]HOC38330.1 cupin domain-containing protein [Thermodesulfobacteriota bacterium]HQO78194.1 cupin domain-containing protein [Thermodesulfobacteriota bacterium]
MTISKGNILENIPVRLPDELQETLTESAAIRIERIVSRGHISPEDFWYDQEHHEFVIVLQGRAELAFEGQANHITLGAGDYFDIPAHTRHRVVWTDPMQDTIWLAVHYQ